MYSYKIHNTLSSYYILASLALSFDKVCHRALEEAELMVQVHRDILNKDCVVQVYGVSKGVPSPELQGLALGVVGEECMAIVMRLETGGSLESWPGGRWGHECEYSGETVHGRGSINRFLLFHLRDHKCVFSLNSAA